MLTLPSRFVYFPFNVSNLDVKEISEPFNALVEEWRSVSGLTRFTALTLSFSVFLFYTAQLVNKNRTRAFSKQISFLGLAIA